MTRCPHCGNEVPEGAFCGACGAHLLSGSPQRLHAFAADPHEHVLRPTIVSTLFPHLPRRHSTPFHIALTLILITLLVLGIFRLTGPALAVAAAGVPLLYLLYVHEVEVYEEQPVLVIALTFGLGVVLGIPWAVITGPIVTASLLHDLTFGLSPANLLLSGVVLPLVAQILMLVGPTILYARGRHREPLDGFTFGVASALGFTLATTLVNLGPELRRGLVSDTAALSTLLAVLGRGLLIPFLNAGTTGLIAAALYLRRLSARHLPLSWTASLVTTVLLAAIVRIALGILDIAALRFGVVLSIYVVIALVLLFWVRAALHIMLLVQAPDATIGPLLPCPHCHHVVPRMVYCPHCGIATEATPKGGDGRSRRGRIPAGGTPSGAPFPASARSEVARLAGRPGRSRRFGALAGALTVGAVALGIAAVLATPGRHAACHVACVPPPPPCVLSCRRASTAPPLTAHSTYTSSSYGYSVDYSDFPPSRQDSSSIGWDLSAGSGQYSVDEVATNSQGRGSAAILNAVVNDNFSDFSHVYDVPGAEVGYATGSGAVYDDEVVPFFGVASHTRLVAIDAVQNGLAIIVVGEGDAEDSQSDHPDPSGLPISSFVDSLTNGTRWPGEPRR